MANEAVHFRSRAHDMLPRQLAGHEQVVAGVCDCTLRPHHTMARPSPRKLSKRPSHPTLVVLRKIRLWTRLERPASRVDLLDDALDVVAERDEADGLQLRTRTQHELLTS